MVWAVAGTEAVFWQMVFADDIRFMAAEDDAPEDMVFAFLLWKMVGTPFKLSKLLVDRELEWIGYWLDMARFQIGMSASRIKWLHDYLKDLVEGKSCLVREVESS